MGKQSSATIAFMTVPWAIPMRVPSADALAIHAVGSADDIFVSAGHGYSVTPGAMVSGSEVRKTWTLRALDHEPCSQTEPVVRGSWFPGRT